MRIYNQPKKYPNENTENNQHEIDEITTKDQSDDEINTPNVAEDKSQDDLKDDLKKSNNQVTIINPRNLRPHHQLKQTGNNHLLIVSNLEVYPNGVTADHPAYRPHLDRDKDNRACEPDKN